MKLVYLPIHQSTLAHLTLVVLLALACPNLARATDVQEWGGSGGEKFRDECPKGSYLVGLDGRAGAWVDRIAPICAPWLRGSQSFGAPSIGQYHGTSRGGEKRHTICWGFGVNNRVVQSWQVIRLRSDNFVQYIKGYCISLAPPAATGKWIFGGPVPDEGDSSRPLGGQGRDTRDNLGCPAGEVAVGIHGRAGLFLDAIGLICGPPPTKLSAPATKVNPLVKGPTDDMFVITKPAWEDKVQQGQLIVAAKPPKVGMTPVTELLFQWMDAPEEQQPYYNQFHVDTPELLRGYRVDKGVTRGHEGWWQVRARISGKTPPGNWSSPVRFQLFLTQPTQSQKQPSPIQQTSPLPSSSVTQPSSIQQTSPLPSSSVVQPPTQSGSTTPQMRRSPSMIMPRGVDKKDKTDVNQTVDQPAKPERKP